MSAAVLERFEHCFGAVTVLADQQMDVVGHDRARVAGVVSQTYRLIKPLRNDVAVLVIELQQFMFQNGLGDSVKLSQHLGQRLSMLSSVVVVSKTLDVLDADLV
ncbi:MAG: hypothetical protein SFV23_00330 [Planctomycetaceae bacterium]|nr:hypothetical protein [Planctomycetaceae bacterium]